LSQNCHRAGLEKRGEECLNSKKVKSKKIKLKLLLIFSLIFNPFFSGSHAQVGENREELEARFGKAIKVDDKQDALEFEKDGLAIKCTMNEGVAYAIIFESTEKRKLKEEEVKEFLQKYSRGFKWHKAQEDFSNIIFETNGIELAHFNKDMGNLLITTRTGLKDGMKATKRNQEAP